MAKNIGIQLGSDYDLSVRVRRNAQGKITGGLSVGDVTHQNQALLLLAHKGELKEKPTVGVGINDMVNDGDVELWKREITSQLEADGQRVNRLEVSDSGLALEATYV
jgi:hypothetical protein